MDRRFGKSREKSEIISFVAPLPFPLLRFLFSRELPTSGIWAYLAPKKKQKGKDNRRPNAPGMNVSGTEEPSVAPYSKYLIRTPYAIQYPIIGNLSILSERVVSNARPCDISQLMHVRSQEYIYVHSTI